MLAGDGPLRQELEGLAADNGAGPDILEFVGAVRGKRELRAFLMQLDIFLWVLVLLPAVYTP